MSFYENTLVAKQDLPTSELKKIMASGNLVSDEILNSIVSARLNINSDKGFILDGYPRTLKQSEFLNNFLLHQL